MDASTALANNARAHAPRAHTRATNTRARKHVHVYTYAYTDNYMHIYIDTLQVSRNMLEASLGMAKAKNMHSTTQVVWPR